MRVIKNTVFVFIFLFLFSGCINFTPVQDELLGTQMDGYTKLISSAELSALLPGFFDVASDQEYFILVPRGLVAKMHDAPHCAPSYISGNGRGANLASVFQPIEDCVKYSRELSSYFPGYAFGTTGNQEHMVNVFVDEEKQVILYDTSNCQYVRMPVTYGEIGHTNIF